jgi:tetratricopeptide (TPR) repeat protein
MGEGDTLQKLGNVADNQKRYAEAARYYEQALAVAQEVGDQAGEGLILFNLGFTTAEQNPSEATHYFGQALAILEAIGAHENAERTRENLALLARQRPRRQWWPFRRGGK